MYKREEKFDKLIFNKEIAAEIKKNSYSNLDIVSSYNSVLEVFVFCCSFYSEKIRF